MDKTVKEHPILFSAPMVNAILDGRKTQTRRVVKPQPHGSKWKPTYDDLDGNLKVRFIHDIDKDCAISHIVKCPYGKPGDRLWVRETFWLPHKYPSDTGGGITGDDYQDWPPSICEGRPVHYQADGEPLNVPNRHYPDGLQGGAFSAPDPYAIWKKHPSIHMPRWASRINLEITDIRVERVQEISHEDAIAEGVKGSTEMREQRLTIPQHLFADLWDSINGKTFPWNSNPWVWVVEFRRVTP